TITGFGNVDGVMTYSGSSLSAQCAADLLAAYDSLGKAVVDSSIGVVIGGNSIRPGTYLMPGAASLNGTFTLDAKGKSNAVFIFKTANAFSSSANSKIRLINGALACNVFWKLDGAVTLAAGTIMRGTIVSGGAISLGTGDTLEGRALTINGAVLVDSTMAYTPVGCGSPTLTGPAAPALASTSCWAIFSANGAVTNAGTSKVIGDVGTNVGLTTGFNAIDVTGTIHPIADGATSACAADLGNLYTYLNTLPADIELLFPAQLGHGLVLTPHTYIMKAAVTFVDTLYLNGEANPNAVFVIQVNGAVSTGVNSKIKLINGTQAKNVFWKIDGAVNINANSTFIGTIICNNGAISIHENSTLTGGAFTTNGQLTTDTLTIAKTSVCVPAGIASVISGSTNDVAKIYPNPFKSSISITLNDIIQINKCEVVIYNVLGKEVMNTIITNQTTTIGTSMLPSGVYFYRVVNNNTLLQSGKLISQQ
ncbi:MAG TPA: ice-binding family protein, partial [Bacteroidia bacterium]|nr:ice-binding family protein [Bacteroidia bacterium]